MQGCAMRLGDGRVSGICLCVMHLSEALFLSHPIPLRIWVVCALLSFWFHGSRRIMGVFWSARDWFCQQHLFPWSSFSFGSVWLVRRRYISPGLSLACERERELASIDPSSPHFCPLSAFRDRTFVLSFLVLSLDTNRVLMKKSGVFWRKIPVAGTGVISILAGATKLVNPIPG